jgi:hypothetical protein
MYCLASAIGSPNLEQRPLIGGRRKAPLKALAFLISYSLDLAITRAGTTGINCRAPIEGFATLITKAIVVSYKLRDKVS